MRRLKPCAEPGCPTLTEGLRCPKHGGTVDGRRPSSAAMGYGARHRQWRAQILARDPWCKTCLVARSTVADHIVPIRQGGAHFDLENGQGQCDTCHQRKRQRESEQAKGRG